MITLEKDEKRVITVLLDSSSVILEGVKRPMGSKQKDSISSRRETSSLIATSHSDNMNVTSLQNDRFNRVENDKGGVEGDTKRLDVVLAGENSSVEVVGLVLGHGNDVKSLDANIVHAARNTKSNVNVRAVLRGRSMFSFRGNVRIENGAKGSDAYLRSDALLFDEAKMGDDTPALEILEQDVKAGHAATVGKVDEEMVFYLMTRGLTRNQSERMIIEGFIKPIEEKIRISNLEIRNKQSLRSSSRLVSQT